MLSQISIATKFLRKVTCDGSALDFPKEETSLLSELVGLHVSDLNYNAAQLSGLLNVHEHELAGSYGVGGARRFHPSKDRVAAVNQRERRYRTRRRPRGRGAFLVIDPPMGGWNTIGGAGARRKFFENQPPVEPRTFVSANIARPVRESTCIEWGRW